MMYRKLACLSAVLGAVTFAPTHSYAQDSDGDGVSDIDDVAPCDPNITMQVFVPGDRSAGMMLFEDLWPARGDFDFNDLALAFNQVLNLDAQGNLTSLRMDLDVLAVGARQHNGLAFTLPVPPALVSSAVLTVDGVAQPVSLWPTEGQATWTLAQNLHALFGVDREWVNTDPNLPVRPVVRLSFTVALTSGQSFSLGAAPFDLFIFDPARGSEVHRPEYRGSSQLAPGLVGTLDDGTSASRAFVTQNGIPFALIFPELVGYPTEGTPIDLLYPEILLYGASGGAQATTFYRNMVAAHRYLGPVTPPEYRASGAPDTSCFSPMPGLCGPAVAIGHANPPVHQFLCDFGVPSPVTTDGTTWQWTCDGFYSAPTLCGAPDLVCDPFTSSTCTLPGGTGNQACNGQGSGYGTCTLASCDPGYYPSGNSCLPYTYAWGSGGWGACFGGIASDWTGWSGCSASCGGGSQSRSCVGGASGLQTRSVDCRRNDGVVVGDEYCVPTGAKPNASQSCSGGSNCSGASSQSCNTQPCYSYNWNAGGWGSCQGSSPSNWSGWSGCSASCGGGSQSRSCIGGSSGTQYRSVFCQRSDGAQVSDGNCTGSKPSSSTSCSGGSNCSGSSSQSCNTQSCIYYLSWQYVTNNAGMAGRHAACNVVQTSPYCGHGNACVCNGGINYCGTYANGQRTVYCPGGTGDEIQCVVSTSPIGCR